MSPEVDDVVLSVTPESSSERYSSDTAGWTAIKSTKGGSLYAVSLIFGCLCLGLVSSWTVCLVFL